MGIKVDRPVFRDTFEPFIENGSVTIQEKDRIMEYMRNGGSVVITGENNTGKSRLMRAIMTESVKEVNELNSIVFIDDINSMDDAKDLLNELLAEKQIVVNGIYTGEWRQWLLSAVKENMNKYIYEQVEKTKFMLIEIKSDSDGDMVALKIKEI